MSMQLTLVAELEHAIAHGSAQRRADILLQITDLFIEQSVRFSDDEIGLFDDVLTRLAAVIEASTREMLAHRLAPVAKAPINITRILASDNEIRVAEPILVRSERLDDASLVANAQTKSQQHLLAISRRRSLSEQVTDILVERGNQTVLLNVAENRGARFSEVGFSRLAKRADNDDVLAASVGSRPDIPPHLFLALLDSASEMVRTKLITAHPEAARDIERAVMEITEDLRHDVGVRSPDYDAAQTLIQSLVRSGQLSDATVRGFVETKKFEEVAMALGHICGVPIDVVEQAFVQNQPESMLILARAAKLSWSTTKILLLFHVQRRGLPPSQIEQSMASFDRLSLETARKILNFYNIRRGITAADAPASEKFGSRKRSYAAIEHPLFGKSGYRP
jgi:uncharacterized protein (DUF2336 family)